MSHITVIAEIGQNHNGDMRIAKQLIAQAKAQGADVAKFQLYEVDSIFPHDAPWYKEAKESQLSKEQAIELADECARVGIEFMASVFDVERLGWCEEIGADRYKVASRSAGDRMLIDAVAATGKPVILSLGMWDDEEWPHVPTSSTVDYLYCVSKYPTPIEDIDFRNVKFPQPYSGFSDHTLGIEAAVTAMARDARIIEKHFTLDKSMHGPDHVCSMNPEELGEIVRFARSIETMLHLDE